jgi:hypothetical protein
VRAARLPLVAGLAAAVALAALPGADADARPRPGKVVRVDRPRAVGRRAPRLCQLAPRELRGQCFGRAPTVGEVASVLDESGVLAQVRVLSAQETRDPCGNVSLWEVVYERVRGDPAGRASHLALAVFDLALGPRARVVANPGDLAAPGGPAWAQTWSAIDVDGDGAADFALVGYPCDARGAPQPGARDAFCAEYWFRDAGVWARQRVDVTPVCF